MVGHSSYQAMLKGKGYDPDHKTEDKDLIIPIKFREERAPWPHLEEGCPELVELLDIPKEPNRLKGMPRAHGRKWDDENLPPAPKGWSPRK